MTSGENLVPSGGRRVNLGSNRSWRWQFQVIPLRRGAFPVGKGGEAALLGVSRKKRRPLRMTLRCGVWSVGSCDG